MSIHPHSIYETDFTSSFPSPPRPSASRASPHPASESESSLSSLKHLARDSTTFICSGALRDLNLDWQCFLLLVVDRFCGAWDRLARDPERVKSVFAPREDRRAMANQEERARQALAAVESLMQQETRTKEVEVMLRAFEMHLNALEAFCRGQDSKERFIAERGALRFEENKFNMRVFLPSNHSASLSDDEREKKDKPSKGVDTTSLGWWILSQGQKLAPTLLSGARSESNLADQTAEINLCARLLRMPLDRKVSDRWCARILAAQGFPEAQIAIEREVGALVRTGRGGGREVEHHLVLLEEEVEELEKCLEGAEREGSADWGEARITQPSRSYPVRF